MQTEANESARAICEVTSAGSRARSVKVKIDKNEVTPRHGGMEMRIEGRSGGRIVNDRKYGIASAITNNKSIWSEPVVTNTHL